MTEQFFKGYHPQVDPATQEPYLRLPHFHSNIIITPPRDADVSSIVEVLNDPKVYVWLDSVPHPFTEDMARAWVQRAKAKSDEVLHGPLGLEQGTFKLDGAYFGDCPFSSIRTVKGDGSQVCIGDVGVRRSKFLHVEDEAARKKFVEENDRREAGDPDIVWAMADFLSSEYHSRGIMTSVISTVMKEWMLPCMNVHIIRTETFVGNAGSSKVFEKNGFVVEGCISFKRVNASGADYGGLNTLCWRAP